jgi:hypothetical protein
LIEFIPLTAAEKRIKRREERKTGFFGELTDKGFADKV